MLQFQIFVFLLVEILFKENRNSDTLEVTNYLKMSKKIKKIKVVLGLDPNKTYNPTKRSMNLQ